MQKDMFTPQAAEKYLDAINQAARTAVPMVEHVKAFDDLAPFAAMDLFMAVALGTSPNTVTSLDPAHNRSDPRDLKFALDAMRSTKAIG